jgi:hypothetical protein
MSSCSWLSICIYKYIQGNLGSHHNSLGPRFVSVQHSDNHAINEDLNNINTEHSFFQRILRDETASIEYDCIRYGRLVTPHMQYRPGIIARVGRILGYIWLPI